MLFFPHENLLSQYYAANETYIWRKRLACPIRAINKMVRTNYTASESIRAQMTLNRKTKTRKKIDMEMAGL